MKKTKGWDWDFSRKIEPDFGCRACEHNPMGECDLANREVPMTMMVKNGAPKWCPKGK